MIVRAASSTLVSLMSPSNGGTRYTHKYVLMTWRRQLLVQRESHVQCPATTNYMYVTTPIWPSGGIDPDYLFACVINFH